MPALSPSTITVPYCDAHDGTMEEVDQRGVRATHSYIVAWNDRWQFARDVAGYTKPATIISGGSSFVRYIPLTYPEGNLMYATGLRMEPIGSSRPGTYQIEYDKCKITVTFSTQEWDYESAQDSFGQVYRSLQLNMSGQFMTLPGSAFQYATGPVSCTINPGILVPQIEITLTAHQVYYLPLDVIFPLVGKVNTYTFYTAAPGTLLFLGCQAGRQSSVVGSSNWEVVYNFVYRPIEWNKFWSPVPGVGWDYLVDSSSGANIYQSGDFSILP